MFRALFLLFALLDRAVLLLLASLRMPDQRLAIHRLKVGR